MDSQAGGRGPRAAFHRKITALEAALKLEPQLLPVAGRLAMPLATR
jgi:hypothetical protein